MSITQYGLLQIFLLVSLTILLAEWFSFLLQDDTDRTWAWSVLTVVLQCSASYFPKLPHFIFGSGISGISHLSPSQCVTILRRKKVSIEFYLIEF